MLLINIFVRLRSNYRYSIIIFLIMKTKTFYSVVLVTMFFSMPLFGQSPMAKANKQFNLKHYLEAIPSFLEVLEQDPGSTEAMCKLAESYRLTNQINDALTVYGAVPKDKFFDHKYILNYGLTLMKAGKYDEAYRQFELFKPFDLQQALHYQLSCEFAHHLYKRGSDFEIETVDVNTPHSDFGVSFFEDKLIFSSFNNNFVKNSGNAKRVELNGNMLYIAELDDNLHARNVRFLRSTIAEKKNIGPVSCAPTVKMCAFARNKIMDGGAHVTADDSNHSIYIAELKDNGDWYNEKPFRYNEFGTSTAFPFLTPDGKSLYFASNRPGGYGGFDLYVSHFVDGQWTYPENLGENINSVGNEITPFVDGYSLYFASDYHHGMGGYDIFESKYVEGDWDNPLNLGNGVNSPGDDYYPAIMKGTTGLFFSSNRLGGRGNDDIYLAIPVQKPEEIVDTSIPDAVELASLSSEKENTTATKERGESMAKTVSSVEVVEKKVINPNLEKPQGRDIANEDLPVWGYVLPSPKTNEKIANPRAKEHVKTIGDQYVSQVSTANTPPISMDKKITEVVTVRWDDTTENDQVAPSAKSMIEHPQHEIVAQEETITPKNDVVDGAKRTANITTKPESYRLPSYSAISPKSAPFNLDLSNARRVSLGEILPPRTVYFIQLAALSRSSGNVQKFFALKKYGNLYKIFKPNSTKIKLGYFLDKSEASRVLKNVKARGYKDAFITEDDLSSTQMELIIANESQFDLYQSYTDHPSTPRSSDHAAYSSEYTLNYPTNKSYKIRLASYQEPIYFDIEKAKSLGQIEQWTKGDWTIFILGGYSTYHEAQQAKIRAINKGFSDAEIVIDNNGILERLRTN